jgi:hypothetical protein
MTRIVIVGEIYNAGLSIGGGPTPGGPGWGGPVDPGWGNQPPVDPGYGRPDWAPAHPGNRPPGSYPGGHPGNWVPGSGYPTGGPIVPPQGGTDVPEDVYVPAPIPEEIASQYVVTVYDPKTMTYTTKSYPPR